MYLGSGAGNAPVVRAHFYNFPKRIRICIEDFLRLIRLNREGQEMIHPNRQIQTAVLQNPSLYGDPDCADPAYGGLDCVALVCVDLGCVDPDFVDRDYGADPDSVDQDYGADPDFFDQDCGADLAGADLDFVDRDCGADPACVDLECDDPDYVDLACLDPVCVDPDFADRDCVDQSDQRWNLGDHEAVAALGH